MKTAVHVVISGCVQGVWFRASTKEKADALGVFGWVRNTSDGCVEAVFYGESKKVEEVLTWCHHGPPHAHVTNVKITTLPITEVFDTFTIRA